MGEMTLMQSIIIRIMTMTVAGTTLTAGVAAVIGATTTVIIITEIVLAVIRTTEVDTMAEAPGIKVTITGATETKETELSAVKARIERVTRIRVMAMRTQEELNLIGADCVIGVGKGDISPENAKHPHLHRPDPRVTGEIMTAEATTEVVEAKGTVADGTTTRQREKTVKKINRTEVAEVTGVRGAGDKAETRGEEP